MKTVPIRAPSSAVPAFAGALVASAYIVGAVVFSLSSQAGATGRDLSASSEAPPRIEINWTEDDTAGLASEIAETVDVPLAPPVVAPQAGLTASGPRIALVIDDVGLDVEAARRVIALDAGVSVAILPYAQAAGVLSAEADAAGHDVLLHLPMEPVGLADPGPNALRLGLSDADLAARTRWAMSRVPEAVGLNNHMGSRFTTEPRALRVALSAIAERNPLFLDSLTTAGSRGRAVAEGLGLDALERDIFLDHVQSAEEVTARLEEAEALARSRGWAVAIGHPHGETLDVLDSWIEEAKARGVEFVTVTALSDQLTRTAVPTAAAPTTGLSALQ